VDADAIRHSSQSVAARLLLASARGREKTQVALIATIRRLLAAVFSVARRRQPFVASLLSPPGGEAAAGGAVTMLDAS
jgi:hypothetical protein